jgi:transposase-like protein
MVGKKHPPDEIVGRLREAEILLASGYTIGQICRDLRITRQTYYRWRNEYGGLQVDQAERMKELKQENARLRKAVAELTLDKLILRDGIKADA